LVSLALANLTQFSVSSNALTSLSSEIGQMTSLHTLGGGLEHHFFYFLISSDLLRFSVHDNALTSLPPEIGQVTNLTNLYGGRDVRVGFLTLSDCCDFQRGATS
jgi:Leucine-rich repeat (LRR) protein